MPRGAMFGPEVRWLVLLFGQARIGCGFDFSREVKRIRPDIPIILCTGFGDTNEFSRGKALGVSEIVMKPVVRKDLAYTVRHVLGVN